MDTSFHSRIPAARARVAAGLTLASYVLAHPYRCWEWLRDPTVSGRLHLLEYCATLAIISAAAGLLRSVTFGVYIPVYGPWRMPFFDALIYYLLIVLWAVVIVLVGAALIRLIGKLHGGDREEDAPSAWLGLVAFSATPFLLSGLFVIVPSETLRGLLTLSVLYSGFLFWNGLNALQLVHPRHRQVFFLEALTSLIFVGYLSLSMVMSTLLPSYPARMLSEPVMSRDVLDFKRALEELENHG